MKRRRKDEHENEDDNEHDWGGRENVIPPLRFLNRTRYRARARSRSLNVAGEKETE